MNNSADYAALRSVAEEWMEQLWRRRDLQAIERLHAPDFVDHAAAGRNPDNAAYRDGISELYGALPDWAAKTEDLVVDTTAARVAIRWTATGTHRAPFLGHPPTNRRITFSGIEIIGIAAGRIVERWGEWDGLALLAQLSASEAR